MNLEENKALGLTISSDWGHFRKPDSTSIKETFRIPPRTTVAGLLAGIVGKERDSYYDIFHPSNSAIAISIDAVPDIRRTPVLELSTDKSSLRSVKATNTRRIISRESTSSKNRQRNIYELLISPSYTIWVCLEDEEFYNKLRGFLREGKSFYTPVMGKSEHIADVDFLGEFEIEKYKTKDVSTVAPVKETVMNQSINVERVPAYNVENSSGRGRELGGCSSLAFCDEKLEVSNAETHVVKSDSIENYVRFI
jgi:CRISPR-associated protein Cas5h